MSDSLPPNYRAPNPSTPDQDLGPLLVISTAILLSFSMLTTILRCAVRRSRRSLGWDDYAIVAATLLLIGRSTVEFLSAHEGDGRHRWFILPEHFEATNKYGWIAQVLLFPISCLEKISICLLVLRIKSTPWLRALLYTMMVLLAIFNGTPMIILLAECKPIKAYWDPSAGSCWDAEYRFLPVWISIGYNSITDIVCSALPPVVVWKLHMPLRQKLMVCGLVALGLIATACSIGRAVAVDYNGTDYSWRYCIAAIWTNFEIHIALIASNLTVLPAVLSICGLRASAKNRNPAVRDARQTHERFDSRRSSLDDEYKYGVGEDHNAKHDEEERKVDDVVDEEANALREDV